MRGWELGVVEALVGQTRLKVTFAGEANHAGTTPMTLRRDAMSAAAEWVCAVEEIGLRVRGLVATVGRMEVRPGAVNVVAGEVGGDAGRAACGGWGAGGGGGGDLREGGGGGGAERGCGSGWRRGMEQAAVPMDAGMVRGLKGGCGAGAGRAEAGAGDDEWGGA